MKALIRFTIGTLLRFLISLRYRIHLENFEQVMSQLGDKGVLFLPNHPAEMDPIILTSLLYKKCAPSPLVTEKYYYESAFFMDLVDAMPLPDFDQSSNQWKKNQYDKALNKIATSLNHKGQFLIYPAGHLKQEGKENLGASSMIHKLLSAASDVDVVLVRTTGLWGSRFSRAITGKSPDFWLSMKQAFVALCKSGLFFMPRRNLVIEFEKVSGSELAHFDRLALNEHLTKWYNQYPKLTDEGKIDASVPRKQEEGMTLLPYTPFSTQVLAIAPPKAKKGAADLDKVPQKHKRAIDLELAKLANVSAKEIFPEALLSKDLGLDSLDMASIIAFLDFKFDVHEVEIEHMQTVGDVYLLSMMTDKTHAVKTHDSTHSWPEEKDRPEPMFGEGKNIPVSFLHNCDRMKGYFAGGDEVAGILSYDRMKVGVLLLAKEIAKLPGKHVGILLPASMTAYLLVIACYFAKKVPCVLNWTVGQRNIEHAKKVAQFQAVLTSRKFLERAKTLELGCVEEDLILLEDMRKKFGLADKLKALFTSKKGAKELTEKFDLEAIKPDDEAVLLFTSGTESFPKAVALSHRNIIENEKSALDMIDLHATDLMLGNLPPFHSFGFSVTGMMPILTGLRVFYSPDPTDWQKTMHLCQSLKITMLCMAPSFYKNLFTNAPDHTFDSVRLFVTGAEKAPSEFFEKVERLDKGKLAVEGYGITECSPIVTVNMTGQRSNGVGMPIEGVELMVVSPETSEKLDSGEVGEIYIHGNGVFSGYLTHPDHPVESPLVHIEGKLWYKSGDLGSINEQGCLNLGGRIKRFAKIGGEMVSFASIEEEINAFAKREGLIASDESEVRFVAGVRGEHEDKPSIVIVTSIENVDKAKLNQVLREAGFANIIRISDVIFTHEIPMTGTGKVALKKINELIAQKSVKEGAS